MCKREIERERKGDNVTEALIKIKPAGAEFLRRNGTSEVHC